MQQFIKACSLIFTSVLATGIFGLAATPAYAQRNPERDAYFGETHISHQLVGRRVGHGQPHHRP
jgi:hypothetical protein